jgi:hypothetical protein
VSALSHAAEDYVTLRRSFGHDLAEAHRLLPGFFEYLDSIGAQTVSIEAALAWAQEPGGDPSTGVWPRRMTVARGFARHIAGVDPETQAPWPRLIPSRQRWRPPPSFTAPKTFAALQARSIQQGCRR